MRRRLLRPLACVIALVAMGTACAHRIRSDDGRLRATAAALVHEIGADTLWITLHRPGYASGTTRIPIRADSLAALVSAYRRELGVDARAPSPAAADSAHAAAVEAAHRGNVAEARMAAVLLPPELRARLPESGEIVVVPAGPLWAVPFAALPLGEEEPMGIRFALRYAESPEDERESASDVRDDASALRAALVVGNPRMPVETMADRAPLVPLPAAEREAAWVAARLGAVALTGAGADEATVRARLPHAPLAHLATHGVSEAEGGTSFLALAPGGGEDGRLTVEEVRRLPALRAELVVLSACETGMEEGTEDGGAPPLQRAFRARGARSVLASLWRVSDEAAEPLMRAFYAHWLDDADRPSKAEALRRAQADLRRAPGFADPLYWAAFQLHGGR
ncbi:MAG TPA: CHAT domain-containing protein [Longimicrobium sp.]|nr:CHAT domain-containing protein [Longimicrobium sp.]